MIKAAREGDSEEEEDIIVDEDEIEGESINDDEEDRKSVVTGKSVGYGLESGGWGIIKG